MRNLRGERAPGGATVSLCYAAQSPERVEGSFQSFALPELRPGGSVTVALKKLPGTLCDGHFCVCDPLVQPAFVHLEQGRHIFFFPGRQFFRLPSIDIHTKSLNGSLDCPEVLAFRGAESEHRITKPQPSDLLNLGRPTRQMLLDELITFAGSILKFYFVEHRHSSASISDDASLMQRARRQTHA